MNKDFYPNGDPAWSSGFLKRAKIAEKQRRELMMEDNHGEGSSYISSFDQRKTNEEYIELLERRIIELGAENKDLLAQLSAVEHNRELTIKWAKGEIEN